MMIASPVGSVSTVGYQRLAVGMALTSSVHGQSSSPHGVNMRTALPPSCEPYGLGAFSATPTPSVVTRALPPTLTHEPLPRTMPPAQKAFETRSMGVKAFERRS